MLLQTSKSWQGQSQPWWWSLMLGGSGGVSPKKFVFWDRFWGYVSAKMVLESPTCSYLLQPVKLLETTEQSCQKWPSHISIFQWGKAMRVAWKAWSNLFLEDCHHLLACIISHTLAPPPFCMLLSHLDVIWKINNPVIVTLNAWCLKKRLIILWPWYCICIQLNSRKLPGWFSHKRPRYKVIVSTIQLGLVLWNYNADG